MDRFTAQLLVQRTLRQANYRRQARCAAELMEYLAQTLHEPVELWVVFALLSYLDYEYAQSHPQMRGIVAAQQCQLEGAAEEIVGWLTLWATAEKEVPRAVWALRLVNHALEETSMRETGNVACERPPALDDPLLPEKALTALGIDPALWEAQAVPHQTRSS